MHTTLADPPPQQNTTTSARGENSLRAAAVQVSGAVSSSINSREARAALVFVWIAYLFGASLVPAAVVLVLRQMYVSPSLSVCVCVLPLSPPSLSPSPVIHRHRLSPIAHRPSPTATANRDR